MGPTIIQTWDFSRHSYDPGDHSRHERRPTFCTDTVYSITTLEKVRSLPTVGSETGDAIRFTGALMTHVSIAQLKTVNVNVPIFEQGLETLDEVG